MIQKNNDLVNLEILMRKQRTHGLMRDICLYNQKYDDVENHEFEMQQTGEKIYNFMKSPLKAMSDDEIALELIIMDMRVTNILYSEVCGMIEDPNYRPCEDCAKMHETIDEKRFFSSKQYCSYHPEWNNNAGMNHSNEILKCRQGVWKDAYNRSKEDLNCMKKLLEYKLNAPKENIKPGLRDFLRKNGMK